MFWKNEKNNLDERQEQELLHIEKNCFWGLYFMLAAAVVIEKVLGCTWRETAGEFVCFMVISVILVAACIRKGIWDRHMKADGRTYLLCSVAAAIIVMGINLVGYFSNTYEHYGYGQLIAVLLFPGMCTFIATFLLMSLCGGLYKGRARKLENEAEEEEE